MKNIFKIVLMTTGLLAASTSALSLDPVNKVIGVENQINRQFTGEIFNETLYTMETIQVFPEDIYGPGPTCISPAATPPTGYYYVCASPSRNNNMTTEYKQSVDQTHLAILKTYVQLLPSPAAATKVTCTIRFEQPSIEAHCNHQVSLILETHSTPDKNWAVIQGLTVG